MWCCVGSHKRFLIGSKGAGLQCFDGGSYDKMGKRTSLWVKACKEEQYCWGQSSPASAGVVSTRWCSCGIAKPVETPRPVQEAAVAALLGHRRGPSNRLLFCQLISEPTEKEEKSEADEEQAITLLLLKLTLKNVSFTWRWVGLRKPKSRQTSLYSHRWPRTELFLSFNPLGYPP